MINAKVRRSNSTVLRAECGHCGRFLAEIHGDTHIVAKCPACKADNSVRVCYSNPSKSAVRSKSDLRNDKE